MQIQKGERPRQRRCMAASAMLGTLSSLSCHQEDTNNRVSDNDIHDRNSEYSEVE